MATELFKARTTCRFCLSSQLTTALQLVPTPLGDKYAAEPLKEFAQALPMDINLCGDCGNVQTSVVANREVLYTDTYFHYLSRPAAVNPALQEEFRTYASELVALHPDGPGLAVEVGSNDGSFCALLKASGWNVLGIEPAGNLSQMARESGVDTINDFFSAELAARIRAERGAAKVMVTNHTMANIDELDDMLDGVSRLLAPDGVFAIQSFYLLDVLQRNLIENFNHEHLDYFYVRSLEALLTRHGLRTFDVERVAAKGGSLRWFIQHANGPRPISERVAAAIGLEQQVGLHRPETYQTIAAFISGMKANLHELLDPAQQRGAAIAAYGTSVGATMFLYQYDLGGLVQFFVDDDQYRQGLKSPGYEISVVSPEELVRRRPEYAVVTAPLYTEQIARKNAAYLERGGKFVRIWPKFEVISK